MAQVLLDQKNNQLRLKTGFYEIAKSLLTSDINKDKNSKTISRRLRQRSISKGKNKLTTEDGTENSGFSVEGVRNIDSEDSESCDDPSFETISSVDTSDSPKSKSKGFSCGVCGYTASSSQRLKEHLSRHTGDKHLECDICGKKFAWRYSFHSHMASHRVDNPNKCTVCGKKYCNKSSVKNHMLRVHGNPQKNFKCQKCGKEFMTKHELERHSYNHTQEKPFICEYCGKTYRFKAALSVHYRVHSGEKPYKCGFCDKSFIHLSSAIGHRRRHTGEKPFQCNKCGKFFRVKRGLTAHMSVHSENKPFKCDKCGKSFKSRTGYRVHLDFHLGIKRHKCKFCDKAFRAWCNMHKHMKKHLIDKNHKCDLCDKSFLDKHELKNHMSTHYEHDKKCENMDGNQDIVNNCTQIISTTSLTCTATTIGPPPAFSENQTVDEIMSSHINIPDNPNVMYDCSLSNSMDKCPDKCQLLQDSYVSQFLYPQQSNVQYSTQSVPMLNMYSTEPNSVLNRSGCLSNMNSTNFNCISLNNQNYGGFSYSLPESDELLSKCKLCRCLFHSTIVLKSHLLDYHRIEEENIDELMT